MAVNLSAVRTAGTRVYSRGLLPAMATAGPADRFLLYGPADIADVTGVWDRRVTELEGRTAKRMIWEQTLLPVELRRWRADVLFAPMEFAPLVTPCPVVLAVHNPSPHLDDSAANRARRWLSARSCRVASRVIFPSAFAADFLGGELGVAADKRVVIHHGTDHDRWRPRADSAPTLARHGLHAGRYVLFVSQLYRYKRPETLIEGYGRWRRSHPDGGFKLVLTGKALDADYLPRLRALAAREGIAAETAFLGDVPADDIPVLYRSAAAFVLPTGMETFGHPYVEAMASEVPVICADIATAREVCGDAARYFPLGDSEALADALGEVVALEPAARATLLERARKRAEAFSWDREAVETLTIIRQVARAPLP